MQVLPLYCVIVANCFDINIGIMYRLSEKLLCRYKQSHFVCYARDYWYEVVGVTCTMLLIDTMQCADVRLKV